MVLFPEGGFLRKRREVSQRYAEKNNLPHLKNVSLPRIGALRAILDVLPTRTTIGNNNATKRTENGCLRTITSQGNNNYSKINICCGFHASPKNKRRMIYTGRVYCVLTMR